MNQKGSILLLSLIIVVVVAIGGVSISMRQAHLANARSNAELKKEYDFLRMHIGQRLSCAKSLQTSACKDLNSPSKLTCETGQINLIDEQSPSSSSDDVAFIKAPKSKITNSMEARGCCSKGKLLVEVRRVNALGNLIPEPLTKLLPLNQGTKKRLSGWVHLYPGGLPNPPNDQLSPCDLDKPLDITYVSGDIIGPNPVRCISYYGQLGGWEEIYFGYQGSSVCPLGYKAIGESLDCSRITVLPWYESGGNQWHEASYSAGANQTSTTTGNGFCCQSVNALPLPPFFSYSDRFKLICQKV